MPILSYVSVGFPNHLGPQLSGAHLLRFSWADLVRCAIKVGRPSWYHVFRHGLPSLHEALYRRHIVYANLTEDGHGGVRRSNAYNWLDPSEKGAVSYFLGMTVAALLGETLLGIPWLIHIAVYGHLLPQVVARTNRRPDLIGFSRARQPFVLEAKGRTHVPDAQLMTRAKRQAAYIRSVDGVRPAAHIGSIASFRHGSLMVDWEDPSRDLKDSIDLPIKTQNAISDYYLPMEALLTSPDVPKVSRRYRGETFSVAQLPATSDYIGLATRLLKSTRRSAEAADIPWSPSSEEDSRISIGPDGTYVELGPEWTIDQMRKPPEVRSA
jgi:hypothetical protein